MPAAIENHPNFIRDLGSNEDGEWRFVLSSSEDELRYITVTVFVFNIYVASE